VNDAATQPWRPSILLLGHGRLGQTLYEALLRSGYDVVQGRGRDPSASADGIRRCDCIVLAVPDDAITATARVVAALGPRTDACAIHLSGALGYDALDALTAAGLRCGTFHPLLPFSSMRQPEAFHGVTVGVSASAEGLAERLGDLAERLGAIPRRIPDGGNTLYHASAVMASAFVVALTGQAVQLLSALGWSEREAIDALMPLMLGTAHNIGEHGYPSALSGPFRRGDSGSVDAHMRALRELAIDDGAAEILESYRVLGKAALRQARALGVDRGAAGRIDGLLRAHRRGDDSG
jgi:predicted short-subunit dehydrogenase-like oxidoreductase (DUF2520 family)